MKQRGDKVTPSSISATGKSAIRKVILRWRFEAEFPSEPYDIIRVFYTVDDRLELMTNSCFEKNKPDTVAILRHEREIFQARWRFKKRGKLQDCFEFCLLNLNLNFFAKSQIIPILPIFQ